MAYAGYVRRTRRLRWLCALVWAPVAVLAVSASSFSALRCTVSGLFIPETCCPMAADAPAPQPDSDRSALWYSPRKPTSGWSRTNKVRVEKLLAEGRMTPAGRRALGR